MKTMMVVEQKQNHLQSNSSTDFSTTNSHDISGGNELPSKGIWSLPQRYGEELGDWDETQSIAATPPRQEEPAEVVCPLTIISPGDVIQVFPNKNRSQGRCRTVEGFYFWAGLGMH